MIRILKIMLTLFLQDKRALKFAIGILFGLAFSISIILATIGIMDGFDWTLKKSLKNSGGDIIFYSRSGFFPVDDEIKDSLDRLHVQEYTPFVQTEAFLIIGEVSKGILVKGIEFSSFNQVTKMNFSFGEDEAAIGSELASQLSLKVGDEIVLAFANGNDQLEGLPVLTRFKVGQIVTHGIYQKDLRLVYVREEKLQAVMELGKKYNVVSLNIPTSASFSSDTKNYSEEITLFRKKLLGVLPSSFVIKPFWSEFSSLIEAVQVEKIMIGLILQLVVIISVFNVLAFVIFINEQRSKELFLFKALGLGQKKLFSLWIMMIVVFWAAASVFSILFVHIFDFALEKLPLLKLPGDIYYLGRLTILLDVFDYALVFLLTLLWLLFISYLGLRKIKKQSILQGLRKEFS